MAPEVAHITGAEIRKRAAAKIAGTPKFEQSDLLKKYAAFNGEGLGDDVDGAMAAVGVIEKGDGGRSGAASSGAGTGATPKPEKALSVAQKSREAAKLDTKRIKMEGLLLKSGLRLLGVKVANAAETKPMDSNDEEKASAWIKKLLVVFMADAEVGDTAEAREQALGLWLTQKFTEVKETAMDFIEKKAAKGTVQDTEYVLASNQLKADQEKAVDLALPIVRKWIEEERAKVTSQDLKANAIRKVMTDVAKEIRRIRGADEDAEMAVPEAEEEGDDEEKQAKKNKAGVKAVTMSDVEKCVQKIGTGDGLALEAAGFETVFKLAIGNKRKKVDDKKKQDDVKRRKQEHEKRLNAAALGNPVVK